VTEDLPPFPTDDATLMAVEHALDYCLTFEGEDGEELDEPRGVGAEYSLPALLDFLSGTIEDPDGVVTLIAGDPEKHDLDIALGITGVGPFGIGPNTPIYVDPRQHYTERDVILALINEVRRLRGEEKE
jgi:hypothetical protein